MTNRLNLESSKRFAPIAFTALLTVFLLFLGWVLSRGADSDEQKAATQTTASATLQPSPEITVPDWDPKIPDVTWERFAGIDLPLSKLAGPHCLTQSQAQCFEKNDAGAAIAAAHILVRTFAVAGSDSFGPTIQDQVIGDQKSALARVTQRLYDQSLPGSGAKEGKPLSLGGGWIAAYRFVGDTGIGDKRTVQVLVVGSEDYLGFTEYTVDLEWQEGDWRLVAPRWGDWSAVARSVQNPYPNSYRSYDDVTDAEVMSS